MFSLLSDITVPIVVEAPLNPDLSFGSISFLTLEAVLEVVIICFAGFVAAKTKLLTLTGQKVISQLNVDLFTPCLVFTKLAPSLSLNKMVDIIIIPIFYAITTITSLICSRVTARIMMLNNAESDYVTAMAVFGNSNSLPVSLTLSLAYTLPDLLWDQIDDDNSEKVASRGILYLLIFQQLGQILRWSWGYNKLLRKRSQEELTAHYAYEDGYHRIPCAEEDEQALFIEPVMSPVSQEREELAVAAAIAESEESSIDDASKSAITISVESIKSKWHAVTNWGPVKGFLAFMNPPLWAMLISIIIASVPVLQREFFYSDSFIHNTLTQSIAQLGLVSIPLILIVLGSNLCPSEDVPPPSKHYNKIVFASLLSRMILPSLFLLPVIAACVKYVNISILDDPIFLIVAFVLTVSPPAIQLSQITSLNGIFQKEMAGVLFWGYVVLTLPTTIFIVVASLEVLKWAA
ncbi:CIC11C00000005521 [Sungouiella intermedia]|uniref:CIC11C00000005521 n=1 Tax=Sungouiella intermedia TaxID=45354 RepID=A0A1L0GJR5_9ASCO|nr:CIC11C00000005521 [[Candida] intermedia]